MEMRPMLVPCTTHGCDREAWVRWPSQAGRALCKRCKTNRANAAQRQRNEEMLARRLAQEGPPPHRSDKPASSVERKRPTRKIRKTGGL